MSNIRKLRTSSARQHVQNRLCTSKGQDVASAETVTLGNDGNYFSITGTTAIKYITTTGWEPGSEITLKFNGNVTLEHNEASPAATSAALFLVGSADVSMTDKDIVKLIYDGSLWRQSTTVVVV